MSLIEIISHIIVTVLAVGALAIKVEHRLTQIETDITWIKSKLDNLCRSGVHCEKSSD